MVERAACSAVQWPMYSFNRLYSMQTNIEMFSCMVLSCNGTEAGVCFQHVVVVCLFVLCGISGTMRSWPRVQLFVLRTAGLLEQG